jgi:hypothetical protein
MKGKKVDVIFHNASINLLDENQTIHQAMAVKNGKIIETGPERQILNKYSSNETVDLQQHKVYPSFICSHVPLEQLMMVIPPEFSNILPVECRNIFKCKELKKYFPEDFDFDIFMKTKFWLCYPEIPNPNYNDFIKEIQKIKLSEDSEKLNKLVSIMQGASGFIKSYVNNTVAPDPKVLVEGKPALAMGGDKTREIKQAVIDARDQIMKQIEAL